MERCRQKVLCITGPNALELLSSSSGALGIFRMDRTTRGPSDEVSMEFITGLFEFIKVLFGLLKAYLETGLS